MGSEYFINSQELENKVRDLLPSQGGAGSGFDLSASTQIVPIIDLTESAEGSNVRQDLQTSFSHNSITSFNVTNATNTAVVTNTGYFRVFGMMSSEESGGAGVVNISVSDGSTSKVILDGDIPYRLTAVGLTPIIPFDFVVFLSAGDSLLVTASATHLKIIGCTRQIANIDGDLTNP